MYGEECWAVRKKDERKLHTTEMRMAEFLREKRLRWFGHVHREDKDDDTRKDIAVEMTVDGKRNRGRPNLRWRDLAKDNMARNQMTTDMAEDRRHWHVMIRAGILRSVEADR